MSYRYCDNTTPRQQARGEFVDTCRYAYILWVSTRQRGNLQRYSWTAACHLQSIVAHAVMGSMSGAEIFLIQMVPNFPIRPFQVGDSDNEKTRKV